MRFCTTHRCTFVPIAVDTNEIICIDAICRIHAVVKRRIYICFSCVHYFDILQVRFDIGTEVSGNFQIQFLFLHQIDVVGKVSWIISTVSRIDNKSNAVLSRNGPREAKQTDYELIKEFHEVKIRWFVFCFFVPQKPFQERIVEIGMKKTPISLIEIGGSHDECLLTQMHAIRAAGHEILLITTPNVSERNPAFSEYVQEVFLVDIDTTSRKSLVRELRKKLKTAGVKKAVLNTAQGKVIRDLCLKTYFDPVEFVGVIHTTRMFTESFTQKIIHRKIKKYFLLSAFLHGNVTPPKGVSIDYFYPLRFPTTPTIVQKSKKTVVLIGGVEERRKDLTGFIEMVKSVKDKDVHFVFLGKSDTSKAEVVQFLNRIKDAQLEASITTFDHFVSQETFDATLQNAALILPLVHPNTPSADQYFRNQISGAMTVSFGYKIPMLIHEAYQNIEEMHTASFYYTETSFSQVLTDALENHSSKSEEMHQHTPYSLDEQEARYLHFLFGK